MFMDQLIIHYNNNKSAERYISGLGMRNIAQSLILDSRQSQHLIALISWSLLLDALFIHMDLSLYYRNLQTYLALNTHSDLQYCETSAPRIRVMIYYYSLICDRS